ncbi:hypothetical protein ACFLRF_02240 [Candidatus Altiarchaeota archaeon]
MVTITLTLTLATAMNLFTPMGILTGLLTFGVLIFQLVLLEMSIGEGHEGKKKRNILFFILSPLLFSFILIMTYGITKYA